MTVSALPIPAHHQAAVAAGAECWRCPLMGNSAGGPVPATIPYGATFFVVAEAPGATEVEKGATLIGASGKEVRRAIANAGADTERVAYTNAIQCRPVGDLKKFLTLTKKRGQPSPIDCCRPRLRNELQQARFVLLMGGASLTAAGVGKSVMKVRGTPVTLPTGQPAVATPHAAFVMRDDGARYRPVFHADVAKAVRISRTGSTWNDPWYFVPKSAAEVANFLAVERPRVAVDVETDGVDAWTCGLRRVGIGTDREVMIYSPLSVKGHAMLSQDETVAQARVIGDFFRRAPRIDGHNVVSFDSILLHRYGMPLVDDRTFDSMIGHQIGYTSELPHRLDFLGSMYTDAPYWKEDVKHSSVKDDGVLDRYLSYDIAVTHLSAGYVEQNLISSNQGHVYSIDKELFEIGRSMSALGIYIDPQKRFEFALEYQQKSDKLRGEFVEIAKAVGFVPVKGETEINPGSYPQIRKLLYENLGLPVLEEHITDSDEPSTDENTLLDLLTLADDRAARVIHALIGYREAEKILGTNTGHVEGGVIVGGPLVHMDGRLRPTWRPGKVTGRWGSNDPNCFDGETEVLTPQGWVRFAELQDDTLVAQYDKTGTITFVRPTQVIRRHHRGEMVKLTRRNIDLLVTPDHRLLLQNRKNDEWEDRIADDFAPDRRMPVAGEFVFDGYYTPSDAWIGLYCAAQADGTWNGYGWDFTFTKDRKIERIEHILRELKLPFTKRVRFTPNPFKPGEQQRRVRFYVKQCETGSQLHELLGADKVFSWEALLSWTRSSVMRFLEEIMLWDGFARRNCYSSSEKRNADLVQALFVLTGRRARLRPYNGSTLQRKTNWQVDVSDRTRTLTTNTVVERIPWDGMVYCVSVPSTYIVVRRGRNVVITGQCQNIPKKIRAMFTPAPGNVFVAADMSAVELRAIAILANDEPLIRAFCAFDNKTGPDVHIANACGVFGCQPGDVNDEIRNFIKRFVYALSYGAEPPKIYQTLSLLRTDDLKPMFPRITFQEVERVFNTYWLLHPAIPAWKKKNIHYWRARRFLETEFHKRKRYFIGGESPTEFANFPIQGVCADMQNDAIRGLVRAYPFDFARHRGLVLNVHDQLVVECGVEEAEHVKGIVKQVMERRIGEMLFPAAPKAAMDWKAAS